MSRHRERIRDRRALPPRLKDWTEGHDQVGLFVRTKQGDVIEVVWHKAPEEIRRLAGLMVAEELGVRNHVEKVDGTPSGK